MSLVLPYFKMDVIDWLQSEKIEELSTACVGAYIFLLCEAWTRPNCSLPASPRALMKLGRWTGTEEEFAPLLTCFVPLKGDRTRVVNPRLKREWDRANDLMQTFSTSGRQGAEKRWAEKPKRAATVDTNGRDYVTESKEILSFLNLKTSKHFREVDANLGQIQARLKSGVDVQTCKTLIARKVRDWTPKPDMVQYLRPETLFNKTKFEGYLAEVST
jgi:uncharacterized phage protein (TIGR02220 family)